MAKDRRYTLTVKLNANIDSDLIDWIAGIPEGGRNQTVKNALRVALDYPIPAPPVPPEVEELRQALTTLYQTVERQQAAREEQQAQIETQRAAAEALQQELEALRGTGNGADGERLAYLEAWAAQIAGAYNGLAQQVSALGSLPASAVTSPDPAEAAPQMSDDEQQQRARKLKKANW